MKNLLILTFIASIFIFGCTPKTGENVKQNEMKVASKKDFRSAPPAPGKAPKIELGEYNTFTLDNGLQVIVVENHKIPRISFRIFVDVPMILQGENTGYIGFAGKLLDNGTKNRNKSEINETIDFIGATLNTSSQGMFGRCLTKHKETLLDVMSDVLLNPTFPESEFEKVKTKTISGLAAEKDDANTIARKVGRVLRYGKNHPYGEIETEETIENIKVEMCRDYYNSYFKPNISYLVVVGDISADEAKPLANKYFGAWKSGDVKEEKFEMPKELEKPQIDVVDKPGAVQSVINISYPVDFKPGNPDAIRAKVMNTMLGGFFRSRLNNNLREDKAFTYGVGSRLNSDKEIGYFAASGSVRNEVTDSAIVEFLHEFNVIKSELCTQEELDLVKNVMAGQFGRALEKPETIARFALNIARYKLPQDYYATYLKKLDMVSVADIKLMAKKYIRPQNAHILVVGNREDVSKKLVAIDKFPVKKLHYYDFYGNEIGNKHDAMPAGMTADFVMSKYLEVTGAKAKTLKNVYKKATMSMQGMTIDIENYQTIDGKLSEKVSMGSNVMQSTVFNGKAGVSSAMGQSESIGEDKFSDMRMKGYPFPEMKYKEEGYKVELKGMEKVNGKDAYKISVESSQGKKTILYYDAESWYKIKEIATEEAQGQTMTVSVEYSDYKAVDGIMFPFTAKISGAMPMPMEIKTQTIKVNTEIDESVFKVE